MVQINVVMIMMMIVMIISTRSLIIITLKFHASSSFTFFRHSLAPRWFLESCIIWSSYSSLIFAIVIVVAFVAVNHEEKTPVLQEMDDGVKFGFSGRIGINYILAFRPSCKCSVDKNQTWCIVRRRLRVLYTCAKPPDQTGDRCHNHHCRHHNHLEFIRHQVKTEVPATTDIRLQVHRLHACLSSLSLVVMMTWWELIGSDVYFHKITVPRLELRNQLESSQLTKLPSGNSSHPVTFDH